MPEVYKITVEGFVNSLLPRDRVVNVLHFRHSLGGLFATDLDSFCGNVLDAYRDKWFGATANFGRTARAYKTEGPPPHDPLAVRSAGTLTSVASPNIPPELAVCLSFRGGLRPHQRGRIFLAPQLSMSFRDTASNKPSDALRTAALDLATALGAAGGPDWTWGVLSRVKGDFTPVDTAWVDDDWDIQRRRGPRTTNRMVRAVTG